MSTTNSTRRAMPPSQEWPTPTPEGFYLIGRKWNERNYSKVLERHRIMPLIGGIVVVSIVKKDMDDWVATQQNNRTAVDTLHGIIGHIRKPHDFTKMQPTSNRTLRRTDCVDNLMQIYLQRPTRNESLQLAQEAFHITREIIGATSGSVRPIEGSQSAIIIGMTTKETTSNDVEQAQEAITHIARNRPPQLGKIKLLNPRVW